MPHSNHRTSSYTALPVGATLLFALLLASAPASATPPRSLFEDDDPEARRVVSILTRSRDYGFASEQPTISLQLGVGALVLSNDEMDIEQSARLGGTTLGFRWDPMPSGGVDVRFGVFRRASDDGRVDESRSSVTVSWMWYLAREATRRLFVLAGFGSILTGGTVDAEPFAYIESGLVLGGGAEWLLGEHLLFGVDVRGMILASDGTPYNVGEGEERPTRWLNPPINREGGSVDVRLGYRW